MLDELIHMDTLLGGIYLELSAEFAGNSEVEGYRNMPLLEFGCDGFLPVRRLRLCHSPLQHYSHRTLERNLLSREKTLACKFLWK